MFSRAVEKLTGRWHWHSAWNTNQILNSASLLGDPNSTAELIAILLQVDEEARVERSLEPEWLVSFALFDMCHENMRRQVTRVTRSEIHVGTLAARINETLQFHGEDIRLTARKVGAILKGCHQILFMGKLTTIGQGHN